MLMSILHLIMTIKRIPISQQPFFETGSYVKESYAMLYSLRLCRRFINKRKLLFSIGYKSRINYTLRKLRHLLITELERRKKIGKQLSTDRVRALSHDCY